MIKAIIFDLNGVFIKSEKLSERFRRDFGIPEDQFMPALKKIIGEIRVPNAGDSFLYWKPYFDEWGIELSKSEFLNYWFSGEKIDQELFAFAKGLKDKGLKIFILSNNFVERTNYYFEEFPELFAIFEKCYFSWQTGFVKPDKNAFLAILEENNLKPEECFFFDDQEKNIEIARELGIKASLYHGLKEAQEIIEEETNG